MNEAVQLNMAHDMSLEELLILQRRVNYAIAEFAMRGAKLDKHVDSRGKQMSLDTTSLHTTPQSGTTSLRRRAS